jgi:hypothetical protein
MVDVIHTCKQQQGSSLDSGGATTCLLLCRLGWIEADPEDSPHSWLLLLAPHKEA